MNKKEFEELRAKLTTEYIAKGNELSRLNDKIEYCKRKIAELEVEEEEK